jgi:hypothetical protein
MGGMMSEAGCLLATVLACCAGCAGSDDIMAMPREVGLSSYVRAPAETVAKILPEAMSHAQFGFDAYEVEGPPVWIATGSTSTIQFGSDGLIGRVVVEKVDDELTLVRAYAIRRGFGTLDYPQASSRNLLLNVALLSHRTGPGVDSALQPAK